MDPEISIVVPLHNEGPNVLPLTDRIFSALTEPLWAIELLLIDDASTDDTWRQMRLAAQSNPRTRCLRLETQSGQSAALWAGLQASRGQTLATLDGDLQNDPADLPKMLELLSSCDMVCGVRLNRKDSFSRRCSSSVAGLARKLILRIDFRDCSCGLRVFKRSVLESLPPFDGIHRFLPILAHGAGAVVRQIPVTHHPRIAGRSHYGIWNRLGRGLMDLAMVGWFLRRRLKTGPLYESPTPQMPPPLPSPGPAPGSSEPAGARPGRLHNVPAAGCGRALSETNLSPPDN